MAEKSKKLPVKSFAWTWPDRIDGKNLSPVQGTELQLPGGHRVFVLDQKDEDEFDRMAFYGLMLFHQDLALREEEFTRLSGILLLYTARRHLREYRGPLRGLRGSYRESATDTLTASVLGTKWASWAKLFPQGTKTPRYDSGEFRRRLGKWLSKDSTPLRQSSLPRGVAAVFRLPSWDPSYAAGVSRVFGTMAARGHRWFGAKEP